MVPAHYEQACNALDAQRAGAGIAAEEFDLSLLLDYLPNHVPAQDHFQAWCDQATSLFLAHLEEVALERRVLEAISSE